MSRAFPNGRLDLDDVRPLPDDSSVPGAPEWRWIHTPGQTAGHVSLFRDRDRYLIADDAPA
jgi:glyoxylase-like metal-dependent hydrolase (beta-lactamase superfamily II)